MSNLCYPFVFGSQVGDLDFILLDHLLFLGVLFVDEMLKLIEKVCEVVLDDLVLFLKSLYFRFHGLVTRFENLQLLFHTGPLDDDFFGLLYFVSFLAPLV